MARFQQYRHSGRLGLGLPLGLLAGAAAAVAGAWLYHFFLEVMPIVHVGLLGTVAFGGGIGLVVGAVMRAGKTRSLVVVSLVAALCGALGEAASFKFGYDYRLAEAADEINESGEVEAPISAQELRELVSFRAYIEGRIEQGFSVGSTPRSSKQLSGVLVWLIWLIELGVVVGVAVWVARRQIRDTFCEPCSRWMKERPLGARMGVDMDRLRAAVRDGDAAPLLAATPHPQSAATAFYSVHECARCRDNPYLTVTLTWRKTSSRGNEESKTKATARQIGVTPADVEALSQALGGVPFVAH